jgi:hypothetical protein
MASYPQSQLSMAQNTSNYNKTWGQTPSMISYLSSPPAQQYSQNMVSYLPKPVTNNPAVLGAQTSNLGSIQQPQPQGNPYGQLVGATQDQNGAELAGLNTQYDMYAAQAQNQLGDLARSKEQSLASLGTQYQGIQSDVNKQKGYANENQESQIANAGNVARNTQKANRNALRALGILDSSAAGELLTKPMNEFGTQRNDIVMATTKRISELDDFMNQKTAEHSNLVSQLENQYLSMVNSIQTDLRFNDRQRSDAIRAVNASLSDKLAQIGMAQQAYQNQVNAQK